MMPAMTALALGLRYFAGVFAVGFLLGTVRTLWLAPTIGDLAAVGVYLASFYTPAGLLGLAGQLAFAALPLFIKPARL